MSKYLKRLFLGMTASALVCCALTACGSDNSSNVKDSESDNKTTKADASESSEPAKLNAMNTGTFTVSAPEGWGLVPVPDMLDKYEGDTDPNAAYIILNGTKDTDVIRHPYIWLTYYPDASKYSSSKAFYDEVKDLEPVTVGGKSWEGYSYVSSGYPGFCLTAKDGDALWVCLVSSERDNGEKIAVTDEAFRSIIESVKLS